MKLWGGRFEAKTESKMEEFNNSLPFDLRLYKHDIKGSLIHVQMLARQGIIKESEAQEILSGLEEVKQDLTEEIEQGEAPLGEAEDIHTLVEKRLTEKIGNVAGKLHTGRSRNDQVSLDMRLFLREKVEESKQLLLQAMETILQLADEYSETVMPGYTHLQRAQPVTFGHHLLAYYFKFKRDLERLDDCLKRINVLPLGSGALAGSTFNLDREWTADQLGFSRPCCNSIDGVSDRDFVLEFMADASTLMVHLSRLGEELILWSSAEFSFIELADQYSTGSSIMPQKKNPDLPELMRGKAGRVFGSLFQMLTTLKGLPLAYNKDMQEDKEGLFDTVDTVSQVLELLPGMLTTMKIKQEEMEKGAAGGFVNATELADYLVEQGLPFRHAHGLVGEAVLYAADQEKELSQISAEEWRRLFPDHSSLFGEKLYERLNIKKAVHSRNLTGGPAPEESKRIIKNEENWIREQR